MNSMKLAGAVVLASALAACQEQGSTPATTPAAANTPAAAAAVTAAAAAAPAGPKSPVTVTVAFTGTAPTPVKLHREADAFCAKTPMTSEDVLVKDGKLANVLVHVTKGVEGQTFPASTTPAVIDQTNCMYRPRVQGVLLGSQVDIKFADPIQHNIHPYKGDESLWNVAKTGGDIMKTTADFGDAEGVVQLKCDIHPWMTGYLYVSKNPYFATTDATGVAKMELPAGKYTLEAWHEKYGTKTQDITVEAGKPLDVKFDFSAADKAGGKS